MGGGGVVPPLGCCRGPCWDGSRRLAGGLGVGRWGGLVDWEEEEERGGGVLNDRYTD